MPEGISPEEKLLNLIKGTPESQKRSDGAPQQVRPQTPDSSAEVPPIPSKSRKVSGRVKKGAKPANPFSFLNKLLVLSLIGLVVYTILAYIYPYRSKTEIPEGVSSIPPRELAQEVTPTLPHLTHYTNAMTRRQMFKIYEPPRPKAKEPEKPKVTLQQLIAGYTFVGIIFGETSQAIVEEKRSKQSYYLSAGQYLGEIKIEKIERGKITLSYEDQVMEVSI